MIKRLSALGPECTLLALSLLLIAITTVAMLRTALADEAQAEDLTYSATLKELSLLMEGTGRDQLAQLTPVEHVILGERVSVDVLQLVASADQEPAVAKGGFIADQAEIYNAHAIRRAVGEVVLGRDMFAEAPSIWRTEVDDEGARRVATRPNPSVLTVLSPWAERQWREVRTSDWHRGGGLLGLWGGAAFTGVTTDGGTVRVNGRDCTIRRTANAVSRLFYCEGVLGGDVGRFFDLGLDVADSPLGVKNVYTYRPSDAWKNGGRVQLSQRDGGVAVAGGDLFEVGRFGAFSLSVTDHGAIAARQWVNGRQVVATSDLGTLSQFALAGRASADLAGAPLVLTLDAALSADLETESRRFLTQSGAELKRVTIAVLDLRTGELRAVVEPTRTNGSDVLRAFEPMLVGSVVKPIVAAAILARRPELLNMTIGAQGGVVDSVGGVRLTRGFATPSGCAPIIDVREFLRCSSNQYAAELLIRSLDAAPGARTISRDVLEKSAVGTGLAEVFDVDAYGGRTPGRKSALWSDNTGRALWPWESRPWILFPNSDGTPVDWLARYAFGGWENRWTLLGVGEAYARIATGREIRTTVQPPPEGATGPGPMAANVRNALAPLRSGLQLAAVDGTARGLAARFHSFLPADTTILAKTGTLNEDRDRFKALVVVAGKPDGPAPGSALSCGLVTVTYFEFAETSRRRPSAALPPVHLNFARDHFAPVLGRHWERLSGCPTPVAGVRR